jgi:hypothetical protein
LRISSIICAVVKLVFVVQSAAEASPSSKIKAIATFM